MSLTALILVLTAALVHATWNYFLKKANAGRPFWLLVYLITAVITVPALFIYDPDSLKNITPVGWFVIALSAPIHVIYGQVLQIGYKKSDYSIVYPFFYINYVPQTEAEQTFAEFNYESALQGTIVVDADAPRSEVNEAAKRVNNIFVKNGLYPITAIGGSYGVDIFKMESEQTMQILLGASAIMGVLSIFGICMNVTAKLNRNLHRYGIE